MGFTVREHWYQLGHIKRAALHLCASCTLAVKPYVTWCLPNPDSPINLVQPYPATLDNLVPLNIPISSKIISMLGLLCWPFPLPGSLSHQALTWLTSVFHSCLFKCHLSIGAVLCVCVRVSYIHTIIYITSNPQKLPPQHSLYASTLYFLIALISTLNYIISCSVVHFLPKDTWHPQY